MKQMSVEETDWIYNGLDCAVTLECLNSMLPELDNISGQTYGFSLDLQAPILQMNMRGLRVDLERRDQVVKEYGEILFKLAMQLERIVGDGIGYKLANWRSPAQLMDLFYNVMGIPPVKKRGANGRWGPTVNRDALEQIQNNYFFAAPVIAHILAMRDIDKKITVLTTEIDPDGRIRSTFNIAGTDTGRLSSSLGDLGTGGNLQNIEKKLRSVFIADTGKKFANIDLAQADARNVGAICYEQFGADAYLNATESGDLHTTVCKLAWSGLDWGEDQGRWRAIADGTGYRHLSYRDLAKKLGHGTNYYGQPRTMAKHTKVDVRGIEDFQKRYFSAFPEIRSWHNWTRETLETEGVITTLFGRRRHFWGRLNEDATLRKAIAHQGQSMTAEEINRAMLQVWRLHVCQIMLQVHDSLVIQYPEEREDEVIRLVVPAMRSPLVLRGAREFCVPCDVQTGWNLGELKRDKAGNIVENPNGLDKYNGGDSRRYVA